MAINFNQQVHQTYNISGSNFQRGIKAGNFFTNELNPGVSVGNVHQYSIVNPLEKAQFATLTGTGATTQFIPLGSAPATVGKIIVLNQNEKGLLFDYPRTLFFTCTEPCTVTFNMIDQIGNKVVNIIAGVLDASLYTGTTNLGPSILTSVEFSTAVSTGWEFNLATTDTFELPYTDMGNQLFLEQVTMYKSGLNADFNVVPLTQTSEISNTGNFYELSVGYIPSTWGTPITLTTGNPRPLVSFSYIDGAISFPTTDNYSFMITQNVFPTYHPSLATYMTQSQADDGTTTFGLPTLNTNWTGWMG